MLFRTVYGPELEAIYRYVIECNIQDVYPQKAGIHAAFIPHQPDGSLPSTQNVDDALAFLKSARMLEKVNGYRACDTTAEAPFTVRLLTALRCLEKGKEQPDHPVDPLYTLLLSEIFTKPDRLFVADVHAAANQLRAVEAVGGLSREKIGAWKRVMAFLGVGYRIAGGFQCVYSPALVRMILAQWEYKEGTLQSFFQDCFDRFLPYARADGALSQAVSAPLSHLATQGQIALLPLQDSPTRSYFGHHRYKEIAWRGNDG